MHAHEHSQLSKNILQVWLSIGNFSRKNGQVTVIESLHKEKGVNLDGLWINILLVHSFTIVPQIVHIAWSI